MSGLCKFKVLALAKAPAINPGAKYNCPTRLAADAFRNPAKETIVRLFCLASKCSLVYHLM